MKWSKSFIYTLKEDPADAEIPSHKLLIRGGYIRKLAQGIFTYGTLTLRSIKKLEDIIREELDKRDCAEILMPMVQPRELWDETNRWQNAGDVLLKFTNKVGQDFCLGPTHEEVITDYVRKSIKSYRDLPINLYQIQTKYRDEIRPRFGLMRGREFIMKDAYSFDATQEKAYQSYALMKEAYIAIFKRLGVEYRSVEADSGNIGGNKSEEFHILASFGEDQLMVSTESSYAANVEICPAIDAQPLVSKDSELKDMEKFETKGLKKIKTLSAALKIPENELIKSMYYAINEEGEELRPICVILRGSDEVNPIKLKKILDIPNPPLLLTDEEIKKVTGAWPGSCGPVGLDMPIYMDKGVEGLKNYVVGANEDSYHLKNVNHEKDFKVTAVADLRMAKEGDKSPDGKGVLKSVRGIEAGHIFYLGTKYSQAMGAEYLDANGKQHPIEMGCYGLGVTRTIQAVIEQNHDKDGIVWPLALAPFAVHICNLDPKDEKVSDTANEIYNALNSKKIDCLLDDRDERPGVKFKDADLLGMPIRITIGGRGIKNNEIEIMDRKSKEVKKVAVEKTVDATVEIVNEKSS